MKTVAIVAPRASVLVVAGLLSTTACAREPKAAVRSCQASEDLAWASGQTNGERPDSVAAIVARHSIRLRGEPLVAYEADLDCDGVVDLAVQGSDTGQLFVAAFLRGSDTDREVLHANSSVRGREVVVAVGASSGVGPRDIVFLGSDEGGIIPRLFRWRDSAYGEVRIPSDYLLRMESEWTADCRRANTPRFSKDGRLILSRETIARTSDSGHGPSCSLPRDTLTISADSLHR